jgi:hypothetical protein
VNLVERLRERFGPQYAASLEGGRSEINRAVADELGIGNDEADQTVSRLIDAGMIRYVTADEADPVVDVEAQDDERPDDRGVGRSDAYIDRGDSLRINAIPGQGGPAGGTAGHMGGPVAPPAVGAGATAHVPVAASGTGSAAPAPLAGAIVPGADAANVGAGHGVGYWEFLGERSGVVPSRSRKGQVEPKGI